MSARPMNAAKEYENYRLAELIMPLSENYREDAPKPWLQ
jgi:hypothetical protein